MVYSISDAVREVLGEMTFLAAGIDYDLLNYSAVARFIEPVVSARVGEKAGLEAISVAVRRHVNDVRAKPQQPKLLDAVKGAKIILRTDMCMVMIKQWRNVDFLEKIKTLLPQVDFSAGEKFYMLSRSTELFIVCNSRFLPVIEADVLQPARITVKELDLAVITINVQHMNFDIPGILQFFTQQFEMAGVNIIDVFSTRGKISFIFRQKDAARAYERVSASIEAVKTMPTWSARF